VPDAWLNASERQRNRRSAVPFHLKIPAHLALAQEERCIGKLLGLVDRHSDHAAARDHGHPDGFVDAGRITGSQLRPVNTRQMQANLGSERTLVYPQLAGIPGNRGSRFLDHILDIRIPQGLR
jgi:hypothetical protein